MVAEYGHSDVERDMALFAPYAGGKDFCGESKEEIDEIFAQIAQELRDLAAVDSTMTLDFENVYINSTEATGPISGGEVFDYISVNAGLPGEYINHTKGSVDPLGRTSIIWQDGNQSVKNQSDEWTAANKYHLNFDIGNMKVGDEWKATFKLKVKKEGIISLFNCTTSSLAFNDGTTGQSMCIPDTYIVSITNITPVGLQNGTLSVTDLTPESGGI